MPFQNQFALSLELTKFLPLGPIVNAGGESILTVARELRRSGSDIVVEEDLAAVFGRNRIESRFESSFKTAVHSSEIHPISKYLDIVLEAGAGPTVRRSLTDRARFSTIVQLSLLAYTHTIDKLANALSRALEKRLEGGNTELAGPTVDYVGLAGTLEACADQTSAYRWHLLLDAVEDTLPWSRASGGYLGRNLDFVVLQGLLDLLTCVQYLPEDRIITLKCRTGIGTIVVWAHHVLGLTVEVTGGELGSANFGTGQPNIIIEISDLPASIILLDAVDDCLFQLEAGAAEDPTLTGRIYSPLLGFGVRFLDVRSGSPTSIDILEVARYVQFKALHKNRGYNKRRIQEAVSIIFCTDKLIECCADDIIELEESRKLWSEEFTSRFGEKLHPRIAYCIAMLEWLVDLLSHISNIQQCHEVPLALESLQYADPRELPESFVGGGSPGDLLGIFELWCRFLVNSRAQPAYDKVSAASARGWTILLGSIGAVDASDWSAYNISIVKGVPSRRGERKHWIVDGLSGVNWGSRNLNIVEPPGSSSTLRCIERLIGPKQFVAVVKDSFQVVQILQDEPQKVHQHIVARQYYMRLGFRDMFEACQKSHHLVPCEHPRSDGRTVVLPPGACTVRTFPFGDMSTPRIRTALGLTAGVPAARWAFLVHAVHIKRDIDSFQVFLRGQDCCYKCAVEQACKHEGRSVVVL
ncbi:MAG: hypothetical protein M1836_004043 [Candelina mexicana]|nr:MAG: hypothetical protein M1836_004043 [Candelina mexicana]